MNHQNIANKLPFKGVYILKSLDDTVRYKGSSGGFVSEMIHYLFEIGQINSALSFRFCGSELYKPEIIYKWEHYSFPGSIYHDVNLISYLQENISSVRSPVLLTCLPCQCLALKKILVRNNMKGIVVSLICSGQLSKEATYDFLAMKKININDVTFLRYRGNGWPSGFQIECKDGQKHFYHNNKSEWEIFFHSAIYNLKRCFQCNDTFGVHSDFSVADPWLKRYKESDQIGHSMVTVNSRLSQEILANMITSRHLEITEEISKEEFVSSQFFTILKKESYKRFQLLKYLLKAYRNRFYKKLFLFCPQIHYKIHSRVLNYYVRKIQK